MSDWEYIHGLDILYYFYPVMLLPSFLSSKNGMFSRGYIMYCVNPWGMDIWVFLSTQSCYYTPGGVWYIILRVFLGTLTCTRVLFSPDDLFILIEGFWRLVVFNEAQRILYMGFFTGICSLGSVALAFGCCCRHEDRGGVLDIVGHVTLPAPHAPIYASIASSSYRVVMSSNSSWAPPPTGYDPSVLPHILGYLSLQDAAFLGLHRTLFFYYFEAMGWQAAKGSSLLLSDSFFRTRISYDIPFSRGVWETLKRPSGRVRSYPTSWRHRVIPSLYDFLLVSASILLLITAFQFCGRLGNHCSIPRRTVVLYVGTPGDILHLGTPNFSSLLLTFRPGYIQSTARGNSPIWNGIGL